MRYTEEIDERKRLIIARVCGNMTKKKVAPRTTRTRLRAMELHYGIIFDFRMAKNYVTIVDAYNWLTDHYDGLDPSLKYIPTAHLINAEDEEFFNFVETTFLNKGAKIRLFKDESAAIEWLELLRCS